MSRRPGRWVCFLERGETDSRVYLDEALPLFIAHAKAVPANNDNALNGLDAVLAALQMFSNLKDVFADRGYTVYGEDFVRPLHLLGINVFMDYTDKHQQKIVLVEVGKGKNKQILRLHCGTFLPIWLSEEWQVPPDHLTGDALKTWYADRAKYRWVPIAKLKDGSIRFQCPQCAGRITTNAKTWRYRNRHHTPDPDIPFVANIDDEYCCRGTVTIPVEKLDTYQDIPYGTPAWHQRYTARLRVETGNSMVKDKGALRVGSCRALGLAANNLGLIAHAVAHNLREAKGYKYRTQPAEDHTKPPPRTEPASTPTSRAKHPRAPPT